MPFAYKQGRFISRDPIDVNDQINLYSYVGNNPIMYVDPMGRERKEMIKEYNNWLSQWWAEAWKWDFESYMWWVNDALDETIVWLLRWHVSSEEYQSRVITAVVFWGTSNIGFWWNNIKISTYGYKHYPSKNLSWKEIISWTKTWPAKYKPWVDIENIQNLVREKWKVVNWKDWKVMEFDNIIWSKYWKESKWIRVENSWWYIHWHPITNEEFLKYIK